MSLKMERSEPLSLRFIEKPTALYFFLLPWVALKLGCVPQPLKGGNIERGRDDKIQGNDATSRPIRRQSNRSSSFAARAVAVRHVVEELAEVQTRL